MVKTTQFSLIGVTLFGLIGIVGNSTWASVPAHSQKQNSATQPNSHSKKDPNEIYAATEGDPTDSLSNSAENADDSPEETGVTPVDPAPVMEVTHPAQTEKKQITPPTPPPAAVQTLPVPTIQKAAAGRQNLPFDVVPGAHRDSLAKRLSIVQKLVRDYSHAYDYRVHTTRYLEAVLFDLEKRSVDNSKRSE